MSDPSFLSYLSKKAKFLKKSDTNILIMIDEIHLKLYVDYKGGVIVGMAYDNSNMANRAFVFMIKSIVSSYKDVAYILPVKEITADVLFTVLKNIILKLEAINFRVVMVVTDNNSINRKTMAMFQNPLADYVYPHPCDPKRPLFYSVDTVHLIVLEIWIHLVKKSTVARCV